MSFGEFLFKKVLNLISNFLEKKTEIKFFFLENYLNRFALLSSSIYGSKINIISDDSFGGYVNDNIFLPCKIGYFADEESNILLYIYKILFLLSSKRLNFFIVDSMLQNSYEHSICSFLVVNSVHRMLFKNFPMISNFINHLYFSKKIHDIDNIKIVNERYIFLFDFLNKNLMFKKKNITESNYETQIEAPSPRSADFSPKGQDKAD